jgi:hypothetical protein
VVEMLYNVAITQWLRMSLDLQIIDPGQKKTLNPGGTVLSGTALKDVDTAVMGGFRMYIRF